MLSPLLPPSQVPSLLHAQWEHSRGFSTLLHLPHHRPHIFATSESEKPGAIFLSSAAVALQVQTSYKYQCFEPSPFNRTIWSCEIAPGTPGAPLPGPPQAQSPVQPRPPEQSSSSAPAWPFPFRWVNGAKQKESGLGVLYHSFQDTQGADSSKFHAHVIRG